MDLLRAHEVLTNAPQDTEDLAQRKEKTEACRVIADQVCAPAFRSSTPDLFSRFLPSSIRLLLLAHADKDLNVWTVAEESLNKILKVLISSSHESIMLMLFRAINTNQTPAPSSVAVKPLPLKSQRAALAKFGLLCKHIRPTRRRKFITSLLPPLQLLLDIRGDEALQETIATAMENISAALVPYLKEEEVQQLLTWFIKNLDDEAASVRRAATNSMMSICRHYPKSQLEYLVRTLKIYTPQDTAKADRANLGVLSTYLQIAKLAQELSKAAPKQPDILAPLIPFFVQTVFDCIKKAEKPDYDHNIIGSGLELLSQMLSTHAEHPFLWPEDTLSSLVTQLHNLACKLQSSRVSTKAVAASCLAQIAKYYPTIFEEYANKQDLIAFLDHSDPLLRGTATHLLGCIIRGILGQELVSSNQIYPLPAYTSAIPAATVESYVQSMLAGSFDASSVTARLAITGLGECLNVMSTGNYGSTVLLAISRLLNTDVTAYWLIKIEILETLSKLDYAVLHYLEQSPYNRAFHPVDQSHKGSSRSLQARVLDHIYYNLADPDARVRHSAANTLLRIIPHLVWPSPLDRSAPYKAILDYVRVGFDVSTSQDEKIQKDVYASLSQVVHELVDFLRDGHPEDRVRGCYHALFLISEKYSFPLNAPELAVTLQNGTLSNPLSQFLGEIVPLAIDRLVVSSVASDLDTHLEITMLIGYLCRGAPEQLLPYWKAVLRHLLRMVNMISCIIQFKPVVSTKESRGGLHTATTAVNLVTNMSAITRSSVEPLGDFANSGQYMKIYQKLNLTYTTSLSSFTGDKFSQLKRGCLEVLSVVIKCSGKNVIPYADETLGYLTSIYDSEPKATIMCIHELFLATFLSYPQNYPASNQHLSAASIAKSAASPFMDLKNFVTNFTPTPAASSITPAARAAGNAYDELFSNSKSVYAPFLVIQHFQTDQTWQIPSTVIVGSHHLHTVNAVSDVDKLFSTETNKHIYKLFEPLFTSVLQTYLSSHDVETKQVSLAMLSQLSKFGVDFYRLDKEQQLVTGVLEELAETHARLLDARQILPYMFDFLAVLYFVRKLWGEVLNNDVLKRIISTAETKSYGVTTVLASLHPFVRYLYSPTEKNADKDLREFVLAFLLTHSYSQYALDLLDLILALVKPNQQLWTAYSQKIADSIVPNLVMNRHPYFIINNLSDLHRLYSLFDRFSATSVINASKWADAFLSAPPDETLLSPKGLPTRPLQLGESLLYYYKIQWIPALLVILRAGRFIPEEARISSARQSIYLTMHDAKASMSAANIITKVLLRLLCSASLQIGCNPDPSLFFTQLLSYLFYHTSLFINRYTHPIPQTPTPPSAYPQLFLESFKAQATPEVLLQICNPIFSSGRNGAIIRVAKFIFMLGKSQECWADFFYSNGWTLCGCESYITHDIVLLLYCQYLVTTKTKVDLVKNAALLDKIIYHINETTAKKFIEMHLDQTEALLAHFRGLLDLAGYVDLDKRKKLLRFIAYLPPSKETIEMLIVNFLQTDDVVLQASAERVLNLNINKFMDIAGDSVVEQLLELYNLLLKNFRVSETLLSAKALFEKLLKYVTKDKPHLAPALAPPNTAQILLTPESVFQALSNSTTPASFSAVRRDWFVGFVKGRYLVYAQERFTHLAVLAQLDGEALSSLLLDKRLDLPTITSFIPTTHAKNFIPEIQQVIEATLHEMVSDPQCNPAQSPHPLPHRIWESYLKVLRSMGPFLLRCAREISWRAHVLDEKLSLKILVWGWDEAFKRLRSQVLNPYTFKILLEAQCGAILASDITHLTMTTDETWCLLLLALFKFYKLVLRPYILNIPGFKEIDVILPSNPQELSLEQSSQILKFLLSLLTQQEFLMPTELSISAAFAKVVHALATKSYDLVFPPKPSPLASSDPAGYPDLIIPDLAILHNDPPPQPEKIMHSMVNLLTWLSWSTQHEFHQIWDVLYQVFDSAQMASSNPQDDEVSVESQCLAIRGLTTMLTKSVLQRHDVYDIGSLPNPKFKHIPREKDMIFLNSEQGKKLSKLQNIIFTNLPPAAEFITDEQLGNASKMLTNAYVSPFHYNVERSFSTSMGPGQYSVSVLRNHAKHKSLGMDISALVEKLQFAYDQCLSSPQIRPALREEILHSSVVLSDMFSRPQYEWLYSITRKYLEADEEDFVLRQHAVLGLCKSVSVLAIDDAIALTQVGEIIRGALDSPHTALINAGLQGILYLLDGKVLRPFASALLTHLFKHIPLHITPQSTQPNQPPPAAQPNQPPQTPPPPVPPQTCLLYFAVGFLLVETFPRECEEAVFTRKLIQAALASCSAPDAPLSVVYGIYRGLGRLLVSFALSQSQRNMITQFAHRSLSHDKDSTRSLLSLSLLITCLYSGDEAQLRASAESSDETTHSPHSPHTPHHAPHTSPLATSANDHPGQPVNNMERVKLLFDRITTISQFSNEAKILIELIPSVVVDLFPSVPQILSFILNEFLKQSKSNPIILANIMFRVLGQLRALGKGKDIEDWVCMCLPNFTQLQSPVWAITILFLAASHLDALRVLFSDVGNVVKPDEQVFMIAAAEFYFNESLSQQNKTTFTTTFGNMKGEPFVSVAKLCQLAKDKSPTVLDDSPLLRPRIANVSREKSTWVMPRNTSTPNFISAEEAGTSTMNLHSLTAYYSTLPKSATNSATSLQPSTPPPVVLESPRSDTVADSAISTNPTVTASDLSPNSSHTTAHPSPNPSDVEDPFSNPTITPRSPATSDLAATELTTDNEDPTGADSNSDFSSDVDATSESASEVRAPVPVTGVVSTLETPKVEPASGEVTEPISEPSTVSETPSEPSVTDTETASSTELESAVEPEFVPADKDAVLAEKSTVPVDNTPASTHPEVAGRKIRSVVNIDVDLSEETRAGFAAAFGIVETGKHHTSIDESEQLQTLTQLYEKLSQAKAEGVCKYVNELALQSTDRKFLVFAHHESMLNAIESSLKAAQITYIRIDGSTSAAEKHASVEQFQANTQLQVAILSTVAASTGITLNAASLVVFAEVYWQPIVMLQCEDRVHKIGQASGADIRYLVAKNTIDEDFWSMVSKYAERNGLGEEPLSISELEPTKEPANGQSPESVPPTEAAQHICFLCQRQFKTPKLLQYHETLSDLHKTNLAKAQQQQALATEEHQLAEDSTPKQREEGGEPTEPAAEPAEPEQQPAEPTPEHEEPASESQEPDSLSDSQDSQEEKLEDVIL